MRFSFRIIGTLVISAAMAASSLAGGVSVNGIWYNFKTAAGVDYGVGVGFAYNHTSAAGFYEDPGTPPWMFTATGAGASLSVVDGGEAGDVYNVWDFGILVGSTSFSDPSDPGSYACGDFPEPCFADPRMSKGVFILPPGPHSITISIKSTPYPNSTNSWFRLAQASGCDYTLGPGSGTTFAAAGGSGSLSVVTTAQCSWSVQSSSSWLTITNGTSGSGSGTVQFLATANLGTARAASIDVSGRGYTVIQSAGTISITPDNSMVFSQIVGGGPEWRTTLFVTNLSNTPESFRMHFYDDAGLPKAMPIDTLGTVDSITATLAAGQTGRYETGAAATTQVAWGLLTPSTASAARLSGYAIFRQTVPSGNSTTSAEGVVDLIGVKESKYVLLYDDQGGPVTATALVNPDALNSMTILADIRDEQGHILTTGSITLPPLGHTAFVLADRFPVVKGRRGSIRFAASPNGFAGFGLRFSPFGTFTSSRFLTSEDIQ